MGKSGSGNDWMLFNKSTFPSLISLRINSPNSVFCRVDLVQVKLSELFLFFSLKHQFYFYREMVRGRAGLISFDVDFFRTVRCVLLASVSSDTAIRVCQNHTGKFPKVTGKLLLHKVPMKRPTQQDSHRFCLPLKGSKVPSPLLCCPLMADRICGCPAAWAFSWGPCAIKVYR